MLHGASYRHTDFDRAAYELRRFFSRRKDRLQKLTVERTRLEETIEKLESKIDDEAQQHSATLNSLKVAHSSAVEGLKDRLAELETRNRTRREKIASWVRIVKKSVSLLFLALALLWVGKQSLTYGEGSSKASRILSFGPYFLLATVGWCVVVKLLLFRKESLKNVFPTWAEIRELLPG